MSKRQDVSLSLDFVGNGALGGLALPLGAAALWNQAIEHLSASSTVVVGNQIEEDRNALVGILGQESYDLLHVRDPEELRSVSGRRDIHLMILDSGWEESFACCRRLKQNPRTQLTPVLMMLRDPAIEWQIRALDSGADELIAKPFHPDLLRTRVRSMLRHKTLVDQLEQSETILFALAQAIEKKDDEMGGHCERIATFSVALGMSIGLPRQHLVALYRGSYLHDIGKVAIPDSILYKRGPLDTAEWEVMKTHTVKGEEICRSLRSLAPVLPIIRHHHERWDGSGYPDGLAGADIPLLARILQMADVYDALTMERPYKPALEPEDALAVMQAETRRGWRDPNLMASFHGLHHASVLRAARNMTRAQRDVDTIRASLINLSRQLASDARRSQAGSPDSAERLLEIGQQVAPVLDANGHAHQAIGDPGLL
jgi:putative two-component system response regulator